MSALDPAARRAIELAAEATGIALSEYREATLARRLEARRAMLGLGNTESYLALLEREPSERLQLAEFVMVATTEMFRDPGEFALLRRCLLPELVARRARVGARQLRVWVPGCATGEEAFSLAASVAIECERYPGLDYTVLASDISTPSLERAARGLVPKSRTAGVPADVRARFLIDEGEYERVASALLGKVIFVRHDLLDPDRIAPSAAVLASFDLVSCRNVLIYLRPRAWRRVLQRLLKVCAPGALIMLGTAEALPPDLGELALQARPGHSLYVRVEPGAR